MVVDILKVRVGNIWLDDNNIIRYVITPGMDETLDDLIEVIKAIDEIRNGNVYPLLGDIRGAKSITREARQYAEKSIVATASAILVGSPVSKVLGNFVIRIHKSKIPVKLFTSEDEAINWLKGFSNPTS